MIYLAVLFGAIATAYFLTTGDVAGTFGIIVWYLYYAGIITAGDILADKFSL